MNGCKNRSDTGGADEPAPPAPHMMKERSPEHRLFEHGSKNTSDSVERQNMPTVTAEDLGERVPRRGARQLHQDSGDEQPKSDENPTCRITAYTRGNLAKP